METIKKLQTLQKEIKGVSEPIVSFKRGLLAIENDVKDLQILVLEMQKQFKNKTDKWKN